MKYDYYYKKCFANSYRKEQKLSLSVIINRILQLTEYQNTDRIAIKKQMHDGTKFATGSGEYWSEEAM